MESSSENRVRANLAGLAGAERVIFSAILAKTNAIVVHDSACDVLFVDAGDPESHAMMHSRPYGSAVVAVCEPGDPEVAGLVMIRRPIRAEAVLEILAPVLKAVAGAQASVAAAAAGGSSTTTQTRARESYNRALQDIAARYRFELARLNSATITVNGLQFHLFPQKYVYYSDHLPEKLQAFRDAPDGALRVTVEAGSSSSASSEVLPSGQPKRLDEFLWHLGMSAGNGHLLPWLNGDLVYRLTRWPSVVRHHNDPGQVKLATLLARRSLSPVELCHATGITFDSVADILNGCSVAGCLESFDPSEGGAIPDRTAAPKNGVVSSLLGRIRLKLGLA